MNLVVDCGSTKTHWGLTSPDGKPRIHASEGMNATLMSEAELRRAIECGMPEAVRRSNPAAIWFYAAGCRTAAQRETIESAMREFFPDASVHADSDLLAAARALCGRDEGIACILGTGSNCCRYSPEDGGRIVASVSPLGYVLGDEGSGTSIGKALLSDAMKGIMPRSIAKRLFDFAATDADGIIQAVYRSTAPNRFLASMAPFAAAEIGESYVSELVTRCFIAFFTRNVCQLPDHDTLPARFTGSIAEAFKPQLREAAHRCGVTLGEIIAHPLINLIEFHNHD